MLETKHLAFSEIGQDIATSICSIAHTSAANGFKRHSTARLGVPLAVFIHDAAPFKCVIGAALVPVGVFVINAIVPLPVCFIVAVLVTSQPYPSIGLVRGAVA